MLNKATVHNRYAPPGHKDFFNRLESTCYFSALDLRSGYWKVCIANCNMHKTIFQMCYGLFKWLIVSFGHTSAPGVFMHAMNWLFEDLLNQGVIVFLNDTLIYSTIA